MSARTRITVAIDPGYAARGKGCAVAVLVDGKIAAVGFERPEAIDANALSVCATDVVWECPQLDARTRTATGSVVQLAAVGGTLAGLYAGACGCRAVAVAPSQWKGSVAKPVHHARVWDALAFDERQALGGDTVRARIAEAQRAGALDRWSKPGAAYYGTWTGHNLLDAVALGLWRVGRIDTNGTAK